MKIGVEQLENRILKFEIKKTQTKQSHQYSISFVSVFVY